MGNLIKLSELYCVSTDYILKGQELPVTEGAWKIDMNKEFASTLYGGLGNEDDWPRFVMELIRKMG